MGAMTDEREHWRRQQLLEDIAALEEILGQYQRNLRTTEMSIAQHGMDPPLKLINQREDGERQIEAFKRRLQDKERELAALPPSPVPEASPAERGKERAGAGRLSFEPEMIPIPAGEFLMGSDKGKDKAATVWEQPQHTLYLPDYTIAKTPVTNAQYAEFVRDAGLVTLPRLWQTSYRYRLESEPPPDKLKHPVVNVSWHDVVAYCDWLADCTGKPYRLPSEAEWEKAARGTDGRIYPWGDRWYPGWCNTNERGPGDTTPVGAYPRGASPYGVLDMAGNVQEWCLTRWVDNYKDYAEKERELQDVEGDVFHVMRSGSWLFNRYRARCAYRYYFRPVERNPIFGFRVCVVSRQD